jgi:hypothetical protein
MAGRIYLNGELSRENSTENANQEKGESRSPIYLDDRAWKRTKVETWRRKRRKRDTGNRKTTRRRYDRLLPRREITPSRALNVLHKIKRVPRPRTTYVCNCRSGVLRRAHPRKMRVRRRNSSSIEETRRPGREVYPRSGLG